MKGCHNKPVNNTHTLKTYIQLFQPSGNVKMYHNYSLHVHNVNRVLYVAFVELCHGPIFVFSFLFFKNPFYLICRNEKP